MNDQKSNSTKEIDFVTGPSFQQSVKKAIRKQTFKFISICSVCTLIILFVLYHGASFMLDKKIESASASMLYARVNGANIYEDVNSVDYHGLLSATYISKFSKYMGDREITWNVTEEKFTVFNRNKADAITIRDRNFSEELNRRVLYNKYNGERQVDFYYPQIEYDFLPQELNIATELEEDKLVEVALSFDKGYTTKEIEKLMGEENVTWFWVDTATEEKIDNFSNTRSPYVDGPSADGFQVYSDDYTSSAKEFLRDIQQLKEEGTYQAAAKRMAEGINGESIPHVLDVKLIGAIVTGTPEQLNEYKELGIVRASTIGATIDFY
ncbi:anti sigma factor C-terminal domain-containing protein [Sediminibacillus massiliensis]|uniref:anti sigma factor C-terminal domain-containing protein n=1 Tax=Sediminibacillus massiliensis TaxID=1926277 RepID=UPI00098844FE|nr:anti sigma factor C-terminal domain-containing protein [Sediminibacillus massiliensis]